MSRPAGAAAYSLAYEIAPIALVGGIAGSVPGGAISVLDLLGDDEDATLDDAFATFQPMAGGTLVEAQYGTYPFANLKVAANARIAQALQISLRMIVPVRGAGGYLVKTAIMTGFRNTLDQHCQQGGYFNVATPSYFYNNALLLKFHDISGGTSIQAQVEYQLDFFCPLITVQDALATQNAAMSLLSSGAMTDGSLTGTAQTIGQTTTGAAPDTSAAASGAPAAGVSVGPGPGGGAGFGTAIGGGPGG